ncbi:ABC transporter permease [Actinospica robiniae]|uniref:ABC transporter permease n=1 Tax=Actinospica robiniae TaxID=304901 RepID=UPI0012F77A01|nr:ABC transporter permease [Actinospica robiniae]
MILAHLRFRRGRSLATLLAVAGAVTSFALLTSAARGSQVTESGTVKSAYRTSYDILVRPAGTASDGSLLAPAADAGMDGGITLAQWHRIEGTADVSVAAPVALGGYVMTAGQATVDVRKFLKPGVDSQVLRLTPTWVSDDGLTKVTEGPLYFYATDHELAAIPDDVSSGMSGVGCQDVGIPQVDAPQTASQFSYLWCWSSDAHSTYQNAMDTVVDYPYITVSFSFPMELAAVDPDQEAKLDGLGGAVVSGRSLQESDAPSVYTYKDSYMNASVPAVPVLAADRPETGESLSLSVQQMTGSAAVQDVTSQSKVSAIAALAAQSGVPAGTLNVSDAQPYQDLLDDLDSTANPLNPGQSRQVNPEVVSYYAAGPATLSGSGKQRAEAGTAAGAQAWGRTDSGPASGNVVPPEVSDTQTRGLVGYSAVNPEGLDSLPLDRVDQFAPALHAVGEFDPGKIDLGAGTSSMSDDWMQAPDTSARGARLAPDDNPAGPVAQSPTLITTFAGLAALRSTKDYAASGKGTGLDAAAPISDVRVRVAGAVGMDDLSRARVLAVADAIHRETGLRVDIVDGSSPTAVTVSAPAGTFGRPALELAEPWVEQGVATAIVSALDRKTVALALMVLIACALAIGNAVSAAVRTRVTELGVLACVGWGRARLFALVFGEATATGLAAGCAGCVLALALAPPLGVHLQVGSALLAVPAAIGLTLIAAAVPAWRATRADPGAAVRPAVLAPRRWVRARGVGAMALGNMLRVPGRTLLGALSLAIGVAACTVLAVIQVDFHGQVVGTVLGDAVTVQVRGADYLAAAIIMLLGAISVADVLYVEIRERAAEFALLDATGWSARRLTLLAVYEAIGMGVLGSLVGAGAGLGGAAFAGAIPVNVWLTAAAVALGGIAVTWIGALIPATLLRRLPAAQLLAEE